ncbi:MAG: DUF1385 domain-containing protein [Candidatus Margulisbacteria bacterium]|jgi:uncharacterized protein YqhQ|nr:DUF1385 domain-containing protein [Candidatus Margulisiibacteriota bacterium]
MKQRKPNKELLGGQALLEGVMMKSSSALGLAVYTPQGRLTVQRQEYIPWKQKYPALGWIFVRGMVNLVEMLLLGVKSLDYAAKIAMPEEYGKQNKYEMPLSLGLSLLISFGLFIFVPAFSFSRLQSSFSNLLLLNLLEGALRILIFVVFLFLVGLSKDMTRIFGFHGAEHMAVYAYEAGEKLTVANVQKYSTLHPRCGTSFLLVVFVVSIVALSLFGRTTLASRLLIKLALLPVIAGVSYELIRLVCGLPRFFSRLILGPGLLLQFLTTRRPDAKMIEAAIAALEAAKGVA